MTQHLVRFGDSRSLAFLPDESVNLVVTSPPYMTTEFYEGQEFDYGGHLDLMREVFSELWRVLVPDGRFALNIADIHTKYLHTDDGRLHKVPLAFDTFAVAQALGFRQLTQFIWDKGYTRNFRGPLLGSYPYPGTLYNNAYYEFIFVLRKVAVGSCTTSSSTRATSGNGVGRTSHARTTFSAPGYWMKWSSAPRSSVSGRASSMSWRIGWKPTPRLPDDVQFRLEPHRLVLIACSEPLGDAHPRRASGEDALVGVGQQCLGVAAVLRPHGHADRNLQRSAVERGRRGDRGGEALAERTRARCVVLRGDDPLALAIGRDARARALGRLADRALGR